MSKEVLLLGACGYVGDYLTDLMNNTLDGYNVTVYDSLIFDKFYLKPNVKFVRGDIRDRKKLKYYLDQSDVVVLLSAFVGDGACAVDPVATLQVNREIPKWISENFKGRIYYLSSCSVYGQVDGLLNEESPTNPQSLYGVLKLEAEKYFKDHGLCLRLGTLYGLSSYWARPRIDLVTNKFCVDAVAGKTLTVNGHQWRPFLHVREVGKLIASNIISDSKATGVFNLAAENLTLLDAANKVKDYVGNVDIKQVNYNIEDQRNYKVTSEKARNILNFNPELKIEDGIKEFVDMLREGRVVDVNDPVFHNHNFFKIHKDEINSQFPPEDTLVKELEGKKLTSVV